MRTLIVAVTFIMATTVAHAESVHLAPKHAKALVGVWEGPYTILEKGWKGRGTLTITNGNAEGVQGYMEWRWNGDGYDRHPKTGTMKGEILNDGRLHFGDWSLTLLKSEDTYSFTAREQLRVGLTDHTWSRSGVVLE